MRVGKTDEISYRQIMAQHFCKLWNVILFFQNNKKNLLSPSDRLIGDVVMLTGFLSYAGPFNQEFRTKLLSNWKKELADRKVPYSPDLHVTNTLVDQPTIGEWNLQGNVHSLCF